MIFFDDIIILIFFNIFQFYQQILVVLLFISDNIKQYLIINFHKNCLIIYCVLLQESKDFKYYLIYVLLIIY